MQSHLCFLANVVKSTNDSSKSAIRVCVWHSFFYTKPWMMCVCVRVCLERAGSDAGRRTEENQRD